MKQKTYTLNLLLMAVLGVACLAALLTKTWLPRVILPALDTPNLTLLSLIALVLEHYIAPGAKRSWQSVLLALLTFGLLPFAASFVTLEQIWKIALHGTVVFGVVTWLFDAMADRISTGPASKAAPFANALSLYLAAQIFMGLF